MNTIDKNIKINDNLICESKEETLKNDENRRRLFWRVQKVIKNTKVKKYMDERAVISSEGMSFWGGITGKNSLQIERMKNIKLKMELLEAEKISYKEHSEFKEMLSDLYSCAILELAGNFTDEMQNLYKEIKLDYFNENNEEVSDEEIYIMACNKITKGQSYLPVINKEKNRGIFGDIKIQIQFFKLENQKLEDQIVLERGKSQFETFSNNKFIIPNNVKNSKKSLTNV